MTLTRGVRLGAYEITELIGVGGMGEVYRARDTRLERDVAIKVLPDAQRLDPDALRRLEREALLLASLNHPNIATLHGLETAGHSQALVMELVEGETLEQRIARSARGQGLPQNEALEIALQIAGALETAHERGIVHRDLKPANIKIRPDGTIKVLDFGIAKALAAQVLERSHGTVARTPGTLLGTPSYMSPEQASGNPVDRRADIWAFGCVLYEMLTGQRAFDGESDSRVLARVIEREPDWSQLPAGLPLDIPVLLQRCLEKDPRKRRRDSGDVRLDLEQALAEPHRERRPKDSSWRERIWISVTAALGLAVIGLILLDSGSDPRTLAPEVVRFSVAPPSGGRLVTPLLSGNAAPVGGTLSPDGRTLAFTATDASGTVKLWVRSLDAVEARALPETDDAALPFWSPNSESLGFFAQGRLKRIDVDGGPPQALADVERGQGGTWNSREIILYSGGLSSALSQVSALGGAPVRATTLTERELAHRFPHFLPDGEHFVYYTEGVRPENSGLYIGALGSGNGRLLIAADSGAVYAAPDQLLYARQGTLLAQGFDLDELEMIGEPVRLVQSVPFEGSAPAFSASATAVLSYRSGADDSAAQQLAWVDRSGRVLETVGPPGPYRGIDVSPDGGRIAAHSHVDSGGDIVVFEARGTTTRITFDPTLDHASPIWSPNGRRIAFGSLRDGKWGIYTADANGAGDEQLLTETELPMIPAAWSADGERIVYWVYDPETGPDQWAAALSASERTQTPLLRTRFYEGHSQVSPDGKWVAYVSTQSGRAEVYVRPFPSGERSWQVSTNGGNGPRWRADGKELYYMTTYDHGTVMAVAVDGTGDEYQSGAPERLFDVDLTIVPHSTAVVNYHAYAVSPDGKRFLLPFPAAAFHDDAAASSITVVVNWTALLPK